MNISRRAIEGLQVWLFYSVITFLTTPSKKMAIVLSLAIGILTLVTFIVIIVITLIYHSLGRLSRKYKFPPSDK